MAPRRRRWAAAGDNLGVRHRLRRQTHRRPAARRAWCLVGAGVGTSLALFLAGPPDAMFVLALLARQLRLPVRSDEGTGSTASSDPRRTPGWCVHRHRVCGVSRRVAPGRRAGREPVARLHARHADRAPAGRRQPDHHGLCRGARPGHAEPGAAGGGPVWCAWPWCRAGSIRARCTAPSHRRTLCRRR